MKRFISDADSRSTLTSWLRHSSSFKASDLAPQLQMKRVLYTFRGATRTDLRHLDRSGTTSTPPQPRQHSHVQLSRRTAHNIAHTTPPRCPLSSRSAPSGTRGTPRCVISPPAPAGGHLRPPPSRPSPPLLPTPQRRRRPRAQIRKIHAPSPSPCRRRTSSPMPARGPCRTSRRPSPPALPRAHTALARTQCRTKGPRCSLPRSCRARRSRSGGARGMVGGCM